MAADGARTNEEAGMPVEGIVRKVWRDPKTEWGTMRFPEGEYVA